MSGMRIAAFVGKYSAAATLGSFLIAYGLTDVLFATGQTWYRDSAYQGRGIAIVFLGWVVLVLTLVNLYGELSDT